MGPTRLPLRARPTGWLEWGGPGWATPGEPVG